MRLESIVSLPGEGWYQADSVLLWSEVKLLERRGALILYSPTASVFYPILFTSIGVALLLFICSFTLWNGHWLGFGLAVLSTLFCGWVGFRWKSIDLIRFDRRGMTICSVSPCGRHRRRIPLEHLQSARAHRDWLRGQQHYYYNGPRDAAILSFGSSDKPFIILHVSDWMFVERTADAVNNWIQTMQSEAGKPR